MFIAINHSKHPSGKIYRSVLIRESYREGEKVKKRTIANISHWSDDDINLLKNALKNKGTSSIPSHDHFEVIPGKSVGSVVAIFEIAKKLGIVEALGNGFHAKLALWLVIARIIEQGSRLSATRLDSIYDIASIIGLERGFDENNLYDCLHWLTQNQNRIEHDLFKSKSKSQHFYWYDVTSSYLEGAYNELAAFGYDRDKKKRKRIIVIGLLCQDDGDPISIEAFRGNTQDTQTFESQLIKLKDRFGCDSVTIISDRGIIREKQKKLLEQFGFHYITALPMRQITPLLNQRVVVPEEFTSELQSTLHGERRYIYRRNPERALETERKRYERLETAQRKVDQENFRLSEKLKSSSYTAKRRIQKFLKKLCIYEWVKVTVKKRQLQLEIDKEKLQENAKFDGCYIWTTSWPEEQLSDREVYEHYKNLKYIEDDFRNFKTTFLEIRPIFVRTEESTRGHLLVVMLAHMILRELRKGWESFNKTVGEALTELSYLCRQTIRFSDKTIECIGTPNQTMSQLLEAIKVTMPNRIEEQRVPVVTRHKVRKDVKR